jgi:hypothetical protein
VRVARRLVDQREERQAAAGRDLPGALVLRERARELVRLGRGPQRVDVLGRRLEAGERLSAALGAAVGHQLCDHPNRTPGLLAAVLDTAANEEDRLPTRGVVEAAHHAGGDQVLAATQGRPDGVADALGERHREENHQRERRAEQGGEGGGDERASGRTPRLGIRGRLGPARMQGPRGGTRRGTRPRRAAVERQPRSLFRGRARGLRGARGGSVEERLEVWVRAEGSGALARGRARGGDVQLQPVESGRRGGCGPAFGGRLRQRRAGLRRRLPGQLGHPEQVVALRAPGAVGRALGSLRSRGRR